MAKQLVVLSGPDEGKVFDLGTEALLVGRSRAAEIRLLDPHVSRVHFQIIPTDDTYSLEDYDSAAGTFVNGKKVESVLLKTGDLIRLGTTHLQVTDKTTGKVPASPSAKPVRKESWAEKLVGKNYAHFHISALLGKGPNGTVFHAIDTRTDDAVALKILDPLRSNTEEKVARFVESMKSVMPLRHRHLLVIEGAGKAGDSLWISMQYMNSENLAAVVGRVAAGKGLDWKNILKLGYYVNAALEYAHHKELVHQSVNPQNILLGQKPSDTKLTDLMLAHALEDDPLRPIAAAGTPSDSLGYLPPERIDGPGALIDGRTDMYGLGATLYAIFTGHPPFQADTVEEMVDLIRYDAAPRLSSLKHELPAELDTLIRHMLAKRMQDRPKSAGEVQSMFEAIAREHGIAFS